MVGATIDVVGMTSASSVGKPRIHGAHQPAALPHHVDVVGRRDRAAALDAGADVGIDVGGAPVHPIAMDRAGLGRRDAALGVDRAHVVEQRQMFRA